MVDVPILAGLYTTSERRIDIFEQDKTPIGHQPKQVIQFIIRQSPFGEVQQADVVIERSGQSLDE